MNGTIGKQMVDTLVESTANVEVGITKLFEYPKNLKKKYRKIRPDIFYDTSRGNKHHLLLKH